MTPSTTQGPTPARTSGGVQDIDAGPILARVAHYWRVQGLTDPVLIASLSDDCLQQARRLVGRASAEQLLRRALEEAQRRFDHALANAMGLPPSNDPHPLAAARAALMLTPGFSADCLFAHDEATRQLKDRLKGCLPRNTPPESPIDMKPATLDFWLFQSTAR